MSFGIGVVSQRKHNKNSTHQNQLVSLNNKHYKLVKILKSWNNQRKVVAREKK